MCLKKRVQNFLSAVTRNEVLARSIMRGLWLDSMARRLTTTELEVDEVVFDGCRDFGEMSFVVF